MKYASYRNGEERGQEFLKILAGQIQNAGLPPLKKYSNRSASALSEYSQMITPKVINYGDGKGLLVSSINGCRATRGLVITKKETRIAGL